MYSLLPMLSLDTELGVVDGERLHWLDSPPSDGNALCVEEGVGFAFFAYMRKTVSMRKKNLREAKTLSVNISRTAGAT